MCISHYVYRNKKEHFFPCVAVASHKCTPCSSSLNKHCTNIDFVHSYRIYIVLHAYHLMFLYSWAAELIKIIEIRCYYMSEISVKNMCLVVCAAMYSGCKSDVTS